MGIERIILQSIIRTVKNSAKFDSTIERIQSRFKDGCPPKEELLLIIQQKNQITQALNQTTSRLTTLEITGDTLSTIISTLESTVTIIKAIPVPTSVPPGIGIPLNVITTLSDVLDLVGDLIKTGKSQLGIIPESINIIVSYIQNIVTKLNSLDQIVSRCIVEQNLDPDELGFALSSVGNLPDPTNNTIQNQALLNQLDPNSQNPLFYKGYRLTIQFDPKNQFSFPARRVKATNPDNQNTLFNTLNGSYSFSATTQVLVDEVKFRIDQYVLRQPLDLPTDLTADTGNEETRTPSPFDPPTPPPPPPPPPPPTPKPFVQSGQLEASFPDNKAVKGSIVVNKAPINVEFIASNSKEIGEFGVSTAFIEFDKGGIGRQSLLVEGTNPSTKSFTLDKKGTYKYSIEIFKTNTKENTARVKFTVPSSTTQNNNTGSGGGGGGQGDSTSNIL